MYSTYDDYVSFFDDSLTQVEFERYAIEADRTLDINTTGIDNVRKLRMAYPEDDASLIKFCACRLINVLKQIDDAEKAGGYTADEHGLHGNAVASRSAGNESISFSSLKTSLSKAAGDATERSIYLSDIVSGLLSGVEDANGVNLLYMGPYPARLDNV